MEHSDQMNLFGSEKKENFTDLINDDGKPMIRIDPFVVDNRYFSPAEAYMPPTADRYILSKYNEYTHSERDSVIQAICKKISEGLSVTKACKEARGKNNKKMDLQTLRFWRKHVPIYGDWYKEAEEDRSELLFDEVIDIGDDEKGLIKDERAKVQLAKLRTDSRKWALSKRDSDRFGEKSTATVTGTIDVVWKEEKNYDYKVPDIVQEAIQDIEHEEIDGTIPETE